MYSNSYFIHVMVAPTFKIAKDKPYQRDDAHKVSFDVGSYVLGGLGGTFNLGNFLLNGSVNLGYQYWSVDARKILCNADGGVGLVLPLGTVDRGFFTSVALKIGF